MSAHSVTVTCTHCGSDTRATLPPQELEVATDEATRLLGTHVECEHCGTQFDCYYY